ncbi:hypothetical protein [Sphingomonas sp. M1-B02]|uniref:hypothetical protein n=1 Tax=Sphingomonas sp. M1-B02 TaxID=3114300 RepID=UPI00223EAAFB|nr:hypothetical protein [Sphingomonas sp. S6-11]UZK66824.1 hypothetical protein OKW87_03005 [Sphingomonas sp. S6-11]
MSNGTTSNGTATQPVEAQAPSAREKAARTVEGLGENPLALVAGGIAVGALVGALLPRLDKERELLDPVGRKLAERATAAVGAAKEAGRQEIDSLIPNKDDTKERVTALLGNIVDAAKGAGKA